jgi:peptidoglycan/LPS O-acetylase OafA/YrhL
VDVMRAGAALMVLVYHVIEVTRWHSFPTNMLGMLFRAGWSGVDMFLVITGFVITLSAARDQSKNPNHFRLAFMTRRLWRVGPLYVLTSLLFVLLVQPEILAASWTWLGLQFASHAFFLHNLHPATHGAINGPSWSIALEMQFYLLIALAVPWLIRQKPWSVVIGMTLIAWMYRWATTKIWVPGQDVPVIQMIYATQLPGTLDAFAFGIALALLKVQVPEQPLLARSWRTCGRWLLVAVVLTTIWWWMFLPRIHYWPYTEMIVYWRSLLGACGAAWLAVLITCPANGGGLLRPMRYLGKISYGIYLWHMPVLLSLMAVPGLWGAKLLFWVLSGTLALSALSWHGFERPLAHRQRFF